MSGIGNLVWDGDHPMCRKDETSDTEGEEKEETEGKRAQGQWEFKDCEK